VESGDQTLLDAYNIADLYWPIGNRRVSFVRLWHGRTVQDEQEKRLDDALRRALGMRPVPHKEPPASVDVIIFGRHERTARALADARERALDATATGLLCRSSGAR
jgi:hypothetical protein